MDFLNKVTKDLDKAGIQVGSSEPPRYWFHSGNYVLNKIMSGSFMNGIPQGRVVGVAGPSAAGKSFLAANSMREAQQAGAHVVVIDSENALDDGFVTALGVDIENNYTYIEADTIPQVTKIVSSVITGYKKEYGEDPDGPKIHFVIDSLDMLMTETEEDNFSKGVTKGDQGQRNKQLKAMLRTFVQSIKKYNMSMLVTSQVYKNQDVTNGEGLWIVSDAVKYSLSQIVLVTKLKLKEDKVVTGIRMKAEGYKTRFTKPFQTVTVQVPYEEGMDPYNGLLEVAIDLGVIDAKGAWYYLGDEKWNGKKLPAEYASDVLVACESKRSEFLDAKISDKEIDMSGTSKSAKSKRQAKVQDD